MTLSYAYVLQRLLLGCASISVLALATVPAHAQARAADATVDDNDIARIDRLEQSILKQAAQLDVQERELQRQRAIIQIQLDEIARLKGQPIVPEAQSDQAGTSLGDLPPIEPDTFAFLRAGQRPANIPAGASAPAAAPAPAPQLTVQRTVGSPPPARTSTLLAALPDNVGVLTPAGQVVLDPSFEYSNTSSNRLVFRGVEIVTGVQVGLIEASDVDRNSVIGSFSARMGITPRLELEMRAPYLYRNDEVLQVSQQDQTVTRSTELEGQDLGDLEIAARYQFNSGRNGNPVFVGNLRYKSDTGKGPFDVDRDEFGVASELPTGSGFWGVEPGLTVLMPSEPAVLFGTLGYLYHAPKDINRTFNGVAIGEVDPGDSINGAMGFGFSVNPRFSFSMGYRHSYIFPTESEMGSTVQESDDLHAGSVQLGLSYRVNGRSTINTNLEFGVTEDAPDLRVVFRTPIG